LYQYTGEFGVGNISNTGSLITASAAGNEIQFEKANGDTFTVTVDTGSFDTSSLLVTASAALNVLTFEKGNGDEFTVTVDTGSGGSGIFEQTGSFFATTNDLQITGSLTTTGSVNLALETSSTAVDNVMMYDSQSGEVYFTSSDAIGGSSITYTGEEAGSPGIIQSISTLDVDPNEATVQWNSSTGNLKFIFGDPPDPSVAISELVTGIFKFETDRFNLEEQTFKIKGTYNKELNTFETASLSEVQPTAQLLEETTTAVPSPNNFLSREFTNVTGSKNNANLSKTVWRFKMDMETLSIIDGNVVNAPTANMNLTLNKSLPIAPSINFNVDEISNFGGQSQLYPGNVIEAGATGSLSYTSSVGTDNNWRFIEMENNSGATITPVTISPLGPGNSAISGGIDIDTFAIDQVFNFKSSADYDSQNGTGANPSTEGDPLNDPKMETTRPSSTITINRARSLRAASFLSSDTASVIANLGDIDLFTKKGINFHEYVADPPPAPQQDDGATIGPLDMFYYGGVNGNPNNKEISFCGPNDFVQMIVISKTLPNGNPANYNITITEKSTGIDATSTFSQTGDQGDYKYYINPTKNNELPFRGTLDPLTYIITT